MSHLNRFARLRRWLTPSLVDGFFCALLIATAAHPGGWEGLLVDGDTGWHVRTGEMVLATGNAPAGDPYSFSRPGAPWFAWWWLLAVRFACAWRGVVLRAFASLFG